MKYDAKWVDKTAVLDVHVSDPGSDFADIARCMALIARAEHERAEALVTELVGIRATLSWLQGWAVDEAGKKNGYGQAAKDIRDVLMRLENLCVARDPQ